MQFKGIVTLQALDAQTLTPIGEVVENNIITEAFGRRYFPGWETGYPRLDLDIAIYSGALEPSVYGPTNNHLTGNGYTRTTRDGDVFGVPRRDFIEGTGNNPDIIQFTARFNPPSTGQTRTIASVGLYVNSASSSLPACTKLATPCIQTDSQIYDVYYRILVTYDENSIIDKKSMREIFKKSSLKTGYSFYTSGTDSFINEGFVNQLPPLVINQSDKTTIFKDDYNTYELMDYTATNAVSTKRLPYQTKTYQFGFDDGVGLIMRSHVFGIVPSWPATYKGKDIFENRSKIQNVFGYKLESTNVNSHPFLDVDNLATGSGNIALTGDWQDEEYTANKNLYFKTSFPERNTVKITKSGAVGVSEYKYVKEKYVTSSPSGGFKYNSSYQPLSKNTAVNIMVDALISNQSSTAGGFHNPPRSLIGDISETQFGIEQVSASTSFDDSSVLICKSNRVILYSLGSSRYWNITGAFTNIHQVAVLNGVVYIACRNTGLYSVNPRVSLTAQLVSVVGYRTADFTNCNGVCVGYNGKLWAVGKDAIASYDGTSWTVYDNTTTPQFSTNTTTYARVEYIKAVTDGAGDQIFFVYRYTDATAKIGFWWSPSTSIVETNDWAKSESITLGYPRRNRQHVKVTVGAAFIWQNNTISKVLFNTSAFVTINSSYSSSVYGFNIIDNKTNGQKNLAIYESGNTYYGNISGYFYNVRTRVYDNTNTVVHDIQTNNSDYDDSLSSTSYRTLRSMNDGATYYAHKTVIDLNGIWLHLQKTTTSLFTAVITKAPYLERHQQGGALAYMCRDTYGWNGTAWELDHTDSKLTHSTPQTLLDGVNIAFNEGATGTSFVLGNHYKFGLCRGLMKDNATRCKYVIPEILVKSLTGIVPLTSSTVPALASLPTGVVGIHAVHKSRNCFVNASNQVVFPGNTDGQFAVGDKQVTGDFHLTISCADITNTLIRQRTVVGIGKRHKGGVPIVGIVFISNTAAQLQVNTVAPFDTNTGRSTPYSFSGLNSDSVLGIRRVGNIITATLNGVDVYTVDTSGVITVSDRRLDVLFATHYWSIGNLLRTPNSTCPVVTIASNGEDNAVMFGNEVSGTEAFDIRCKGVVFELGAKGKLNGVDAVVKFDGTYPVPGEISVDAESLIATFNTADVGKTIEIDCTRVWDM